MASECGQRTRDEIRHHDSHSGGVTTLRAPVTSPNAVNIDEVVVRCARSLGENLVACGFKTYALRNALASRSAGQAVRGRKIDYDSGPYQCTSAKELCGSRGRGDRVLADFVYCIERLRLATSAGRPR